MRLNRVLENTHEAEIALHEIAEATRSQNTVAPRVIVVSREEREELEARQAALPLTVAAPRVQPEPSAFGALLARVGLTGGKKKADASSRLLDQAATPTGSYHAV